MRLWSIHPRYLDTAGLTACWREGLLARKVLLGQTTGYKNHPQLKRFRACPDPVAAIDCFLGAVCDEADRRGYKYDRAKIENRQATGLITVTRGQLKYELEHLVRKLQKRNPSLIAGLLGIEKLLVNPLFTVIEGGIEEWEIL